MNVIIMDMHLPNDGRIQRHIEYLVSQNINVFHLHYNLNWESLNPGLYDYCGGKNFRINFLKKKKGLISGILRLIKLFGPDLIDATEKALQQMNMDIDQQTVIHVHDPLMLPIAANLVRNRHDNIKIVYDRHEFYEKFGLPGFHGINLYTIIEFISRRYISGIVIVNKDQAQYSKRIFYRSKMIIVPNFPNLKVFNSNIITKKINSFDKYSRINLIYVGSLNREFDRDIDLLLKLIKAVIINDKRIYFTIAGKYADNQLEELLKDYQNLFPDRFSYLGFISQAQNVDLTQDAHLGFYFLKPDTKYWVKLSANKIFDYLACGVVPVTRANLDIADELKDFSLVFGQHDNEEDIIRAVVDLTSDTNRFRESMKLAFKAGRKYSWDLVAIEYINLYNKLLSN